MLHARPRSHHLENSFTVGPDAQDDAVGRRGSSTHFSHVAYDAGAYMRGGASGGDKEPTSEYTPFIMSHTPITGQSSNLGQQPPATREFVFPDMAADSQYVSRNAGFEPGNLLFEQEQTMYPMGVGTGKLRRPFVRKPKQQRHRSAHSHNVGQSVPHREPWTGLGMPLPPLSKKF